MSTQTAFWKLGSVAVTVDRKGEPESAFVMLTYCVTLGQSSFFSGFQFPDCFMGQMKQ